MGGWTCVNPSHCVQGSSLYYLLEKFWAILVGVGGIGHLCLAWRSMSWGLHSEKAVFHPIKCTHTLWCMQSSAWNIPKEPAHGPAWRDRWLGFSITVCEWRMVGGTLAHSGDVPEESASDLEGELRTLASRSHFPGTCHWDSGKR